jgi:hypothetical protein
VAIANASAASPKNPILRVFMLVSVSLVALFRFHASQFGRGK